VPHSASLNIPDRDDSKELHQEVHLLHADALVPTEGARDESRDQPVDGVDGGDAGVARPYGRAVRVRLRLDLLEEAHGDVLERRLNPHEPEESGR